MYDAIVSVYSHNKVREWYDDIVVIWSLSKAREWYRDILSGLITR